MEYNNHWREDGNSTPVSYIGSGSSTSKLPLSTSSTFLSVSPSKVASCSNIHKTDLRIAKELSSSRQVQLSLVVVDQPKSKATTHLHSTSITTTNAQSRFTFSNCTSSGSGAYASNFFRRSKSRSRNLIYTFEKKGDRNRKRRQQQQQQQQSDYPSQSNKTKTFSLGNQRPSFNLVANLLFITATLLLFQVHSYSFRSIEENQAQANNLRLSEDYSTVTTQSAISLKDQVLSFTTSAENKLENTKTTTATATTLSIESTGLAVETAGSITLEEDEFASTKDDDGDTEGCTGISANESAEGKNISDAKRLVNLQTCIQSKIKLKLAETSRGGMEMFQKLSLSGGCSASLMNLMFSLAQVKSFAFKFLDASAKVPSGVMYGLLSDFGDFDQCVSIRSNPEIPREIEAEEGAYSGKYCLMNIFIKYHIKLEPNTSVPEGIYPDGVLWDELMRKYWTSNSSKGFQVGMCFPSRCTMDDLNQLYQYVADSYNFRGEIISCQDGLDLKNQFTPDLVQRFILSTFYTILFLTIVGSFIDRYHPDLSSFYSMRDFSVDKVGKTSADKGDRITFGLEILRCFSLSRNWRFFTRVDSRQTLEWDCLTNTSFENNKSQRTSIEEISARSSMIDQNTSYRFNNSSATIVDQYKAQDDKLGNLTVRIRTDEYIELKQIISLAHLSGLKLFVILWITVGYSFLYPSANNYQHYRSIINMNITRDSVWFATTNFTLGIDMLLYMTGLVFVCNSSMSDSKTYRLGNKFSNYIKQAEGGIFRMIMRKILKFCPTYLTVIAIAIIVPLIGDGPMWPEIVTKKIGETCRHNWWANLLFINNFSRESEICLPSSWFLSVLVQLFVTGSAIILLERKHSALASWAALTTLLVASCAYSFTYSYLLDIHAPVIKMDESFVLEMDEKIWRFYINTLNNLGPFLVGMAGGFILLNTRPKQVSPGRTNSAKRSSRSPTKQVPSVFAWFNQASKAALIMIIAILVLSSVFQKRYTRIWSSIYWSLHRVGWAIVTGYIIHNCATDRWKLLNDMLSLTVFKPLSKLIFISYLIYPIFTHIHSGLVRDGLHVSTYNMLTTYTTRLVLTFNTALLIHLFVELPIHRIGESCLTRWFKVKQTPSNTNESRKVHPLLAVAPPISCKESENKYEQTSNEEISSIDCEAISSGEENAEPKPEKMINLVETTSEVS